MNLREQFLEHFIANDMDEDGNLTGDRIGILLTYPYTIDILECDIIRKVEIYPNPVRTNENIKYVSILSMLYLISSRQKE